MPSSHTSESNVSSAKNAKLPTVLTEPKNDRPSRRTIPTPDSIPTIFCGNEAINETLKQRRPSRKSIATKDNMDTIFSGNPAMRPVNPSKTRIPASPAHERHLGANPLDSTPDEGPRKTPKRRATYSAKMFGDGEILHAEKTNIPKLKPAKKTNEIGSKAKDSKNRLFTNKELEMMKPRIRGDGHETHYKGTHSDGLWRELPDFVRNKAAPPAGMVEGRPKVIDTPFGTRDHSILITPSCNSRRRRTTVGFQTTRTPGGRDLDTRLTPSMHYMSGGAASGMLATPSASANKYRSSIKSENEERNSPLPSSNFRAKSVGNAAVAGGKVKFEVDGPMLTTKQNAAWVGRSLIPSTHNCCMRCNYTECIY
eukprot:Platyproteum_vivax@DN7146_c0_g1_i1.p1